MHSVSGLRSLVAAVIAVAALPASANEQLEYGQHLSGECTTCHRDGANNTIPPIVGWPVDSFIAIMNAYKKGERDNKAMVSVAKSLDDEQIAALAAYFATIKPKDQ